MRVRQVFLVIGVSNFPPVPEIRIGDKKVMKTLELTISWVSFSELQAKFPEVVCEHIKAGYYHFTNGKVIFRGPDLASGLYDDGLLASLAFKA